MLLPPEVAKGMTVLPLNVWSSESYHACMNGRVTTNEDEVKSYASMKVLIIVGQVYHL